MSISRELMNNKSILEKQLYIYNKDVGEEISLDEENSTTENNSGKDYVIELSKWGIVSDSINELNIKNVTLDKWLRAYNNLLGFNSALKYANYNGYTKVIVPKGEYCFCYTNLKGGAEIYNMENISINIFSNQILDLNGSTFYMLYDSHNKNPYDKSPNTTPPWKLSGTLIRMVECRNSHIINGILKGDIYNRSFDDNGTGFNTEKAMEQTYGIVIDKGSSYCSVDNVICKGFMGDGIQIGNRSGNNDQKLALDPVFKKGKYDSINNKDVIDQAGYFTTEYIDLKSAREIQMKAGVGYTRIPKLANKNFKFLWFDKGKKFINSKDGHYLMNVVVPYNAKFVRVELSEEDDKQTNITKGIIISTPATNFITIKNCILTENHRGGISGGADFTLIEGCKIYNNGMGMDEGFPVFPDSTRYCINFEDSYASKVTIRNCYFYYSYHGLLLGAYNIHVEDNVFFNVNGCFIYNNQSSTITDNVFINSSAILGIQDVLPNVNRKIVFSNNTSVNSGINITCDKTINSKTDLLFINNVLELNNSFTMLGHNIYSLNNIIKCNLIKIGKGILFENNKITIDKTKVSNEYNEFFSDTAGIKNNQFIQNNDIATYVSNLFSFSNNKVSGMLFRIRHDEKKPKSSIEFKKCDLTDFQIQCTCVNPRNASDNVISFEDCKIYLTKSIIATQDNVGIINHITKFKNSEFNIKDSSIYIITGFYTPINGESIFENCLFIMEGVNSELKLMNIKDIGKSKVSLIDCKTINCTVPKEIKKLLVENYDRYKPIISENKPDSIPNFIGQKYMDMINKKVYIAFGTNSIDDWLNIN